MIQAEEIALEFDCTLRERRKGRCDRRTSERG